MRKYREPVKTFQIVAAYDDVVLGEVTATRATTSLHTAPAGATNRS